MLHTIGTLETLLQLQRESRYSYPTDQQSPISNHRSAIIDQQLEILQGMNDGFTRWLHRDQQLAFPHTMASHDGLCRGHCRLTLLNESVTVNSNPALVNFCTSSLHRTFGSRAGGVSFILPHCKQSTINNHRSPISDSISNHRSPISNHRSTIPASILRGISVSQR